MITGSFYTNEGDFVLVYKHDDLVELVERRIGYEPGQMIKKLAELATREAAIAGTDFRNLEEELSELHMALTEIDDEAQRLLKAVEKDRLSVADKQLIRSMARKINSLV